MKISQGLSFGEPNRIAICEGKIRTNTMIISETKMLIPKDKATKCNAVLFRRGNIMGASYRRVPNTERKATTEPNSVKIPKSSAVYSRANMSEAAKGISCDNPEPNIKITTFLR